jgi:hypothetical protein
MGIGLEDFFFYLYHLVVALIVQHLFNFRRRSIITCALEKYGYWTCSGGRLFLLFVLVVAPIVVQHLLNLEGEVL